MGAGDYGKTPNVYRPSEVPPPNTGQDVGVGAAPVFGNVTTTTVTEYGYPSSGGDVDTAVHIGLHQINDETSGDQNLLVVSGIPDENTWVLHTLIVGYHIWLGPENGLITLRTWFNGIKMLEGDFQLAVGSTNQWGRFFCECWLVAGVAGGLRNIWPVVLVHTAATTAGALTENMTFDWAEASGNGGSWVDVGGTYISGEEISVSNRAVEGTTNSWVTYGGSNEFKVTANFQAVNSPALQRIKRRAAASHWYKTGAPRLTITT